MTRKIPDVADIEIVELTRETDRDGTAGIIVPTEIRINGKPVLAPADEPVILHDVKIGAREPVKVTLTLFARITAHRETIPED